MRQFSDGAESGRWLGLGASLMLHGTAFAAVALGTGWWQPTAAPGGTAIPVVWVEEAATSAPELPVAAMLPVPSAAAATQPPVLQPVPAPARVDMPPPRPPARRPAVAQATVPPPAGTSAAAPSAPMASGAATALDTSDVPVRSPAASETADTVSPPSQSLAAAPAASVAGWAVIARPPPTYPAAARRRGAEGEVLVRADIDAAGIPRVVSVLRGSGHPDLDAAAVTAVERWRFRAPGPFSLEVPLVFRIEGQRP